MHCAGRGARCEAGHGVALHFRSLLCISPPHIAISPISAVESTADMAIVDSIPSYLLFLSVQSPLPPSASVSSAVESPAEAPIANSIPSYFLLRRWKAPPKRQLHIPRRRISTPIASSYPQHPQDRRATITGTVFFAYGTVHAVFAARGEGGENAVFEAVRA